MSCDALIKSSALEAGKHDEVKIEVLEKFKFSNRFSWFEKKERELKCRGQKFLK
jgi:hypothetical protein